MKKILNFIKENIFNIILFIIGLVIDQVSKELFIDKDFYAISNILQIAYWENYGAILGLFSNHRFIILFIELLIVIALLVYWKMSKRNRIKNTALTFILIGTVGNLTDRIVRGYVIDFLKLTIIKNSPVFNLSDIFISIGFIILIISLIPKSGNKKSA